MAKDENIEISGSVLKDYDFHLVCTVEDNLEYMDALSVQLLAC